jgi:hypothetical protein
MSGGKLWRRHKHDGSCEATEGEEDDDNDDEEEEG